MLVLNKYLIIKNSINWNGKRKFTSTRTKSDTRDQILKWNGAMLPLE